MKKAAAIIFIIIPFLFMFGCDQNKETAVNEVEEEDSTVEMETKTEEVVEEEEAAIPNLTNYETVRLEEKTDQREIVIEYPDFKYEPVDKVIVNRMETDFTNQMGLADELLEISDAEDGFGSFHFYYLGFDEPTITEDYVSIHFDGNISMGAPSGQPVDYSFNYDLKEDKIISLEDILREYQTNVIEISNLVAEKIIKDDRFAGYRDEPVSANYLQMVEEETEPSSDNYQSFTIDEEGITFYKTYFSILPNSEGIVGVKINWDELGVTDESSEETSQSRDLEGTYTNEEYHFSLNIPESWEGKYTTKNGNWHPTALASVDFQFVHDGEEVSNIFSINIYDVSTDVSPGMEMVIAESDDYLFTYNTIMELPLAFYEGGELSHLEGEFLEMVNEDVEAVVNSFTLQ